jgi:hypothetical protein
MFSHIVLHLTKLLQNVCLLIWLLFCLFVRFLTYYYTFFSCILKSKFPIVIKANINEFNQTSTFCIVVLTIVLYFSNV